jgi:hypothetical protein
MNMFANQTTLICLPVPREHIKVCEVSASASNVHIQSSVKMAMFLNNSQFNATTYKDGEHLAYEDEGNVNDLQNTIGNFDDFLYSFS